MTKERIVVGFTHVDLGWKKQHEEMEELHEKLILLLVDQCEQTPDMRYMIEQAIHFRYLKDRRPELFARVKQLVKRGNLELGCGMASSIENNMTNGECFIRNMQLGARWFAENMDVRAADFEMIDTFGFPPQFPQLLRQMGYHSLYANRLGGTNHRDVFQAVGLDGSMVTVCGRMTNSLDCKQGHICFGFYLDQDGLDRLFEEAEANACAWALVMPYSENEVFPSAYIWKKMREGKAQYRFGTLREVLDRAERMENLPRQFADLNPEFTGTFSLRHRLKAENRKAESLLLAAEELCAILNAQDANAALEDAWWKLLYVQFHDILTGSHPTKVYHEAMRQLDEVQRQATDTLLSLLPNQTESSELVYGLWNSLPWQRFERVTIPIPQDWAGCEILADDVEVSDVYQEGSSICFVAHMSAMAGGTVRLRKKGAMDMQGKPISHLENRCLKITFSEENMIEEVLYKPTNRVVMSRVDNLLVAQRDCGSFQVEQPEGTEIPCGIGEFHTKISRIGQTQIAEIEGEFPEADGKPVAYRIEMKLDGDNPYVDLKLHVRWQSEGMRLRLRMDTTLASCLARCEVPFGVAERAPYAGRETAKGEWAAHRFAALEDDGTHEGIALMNQGCPGVEPGYRCLTTTLLRSPRRQVAGMAPDDTSSEHGEHDFAFRLYFYHGGWESSDAVSLAQQLNAPLWLLPGRICKLPAGLQWDNRRIAFSSLKLSPEGYLCLRVYETTGNCEQTELRFLRPVDIYSSDVQEKPQSLLNSNVQSVIITLKPFEIRTLLYHIVE